MNHPPSLEANILNRSFRADTGEFGLLQDDVPAFLAACRRDDIAVLGWELWVIDHDWALDGSGKPVPVKGAICSGIPCRDQDRPTLVAGSGDGGAVGKAVASLRLDQLVEPQWIGHIRVNIALDIILDDED